MELIPWIGSNALLYSSELKNIVSKLLHNLFKTTQTIFLPNDCVEGIWTQEPFYNHPVKNPNFINYLKSWNDFKKLKLILLIGSILSIHANWVKYQ